MITGDERYYPSVEVTDIEDGIEITHTHQGITIRQQFAAMAMQGLLSAIYSNPEILLAMQNKASGQKITFGRYIANQSDAYAANLIHELNTEK